MSDNIQRAADIIDEASDIFAFVGAGFSAESGVPTFRGDDGIFADEEIAELAYAETFKREPERVMEWFEKVRRMMADIEPNAGHRALARLAGRDGTRVVVGTQNIDGLVERAAASEGVSTNEADASGITVHHIHGTMERLRCSDCGRRAEEVAEHEIDLSEMPTCEHCDGLLRPDVVLFGEMLPSEAFDASVEAARGCDVCLLLGTSGIVYPAADLPRQAKARGARLVEINPEPTDLSEICDVTIRQKTGEALPAIVG